VLTPPDHDRKHRFEQLWPDHLARQITGLAHIERVVLASSGQIMWPGVLLRTSPPGAFDLEATKCPSSGQQMVNVLKEKEKKIKTSFKENLD
jgi:hypothetical protein